MRPHSLATVLILGCAAAGFGQTPAIDPTRVVENAGNFIAGQGVAPGSFVAIFGSNFASSLSLADSIPLSNSLGGVTVTFNGVPAPLAGVAPNATADHMDQINAQLPWDVLAGGQTGTAQVVVSRNGVPSAPANVSIVPAYPGLMIISGPDATGVLRPVAYNNGDFTLAFPPTAFPNSGLRMRPAKINDPNALVLLATGLGAVTLIPPNGAPPTQNGQYAESDTVTKPVVLIGGVPATVLFSGLSPQFPSLYQLNIIVSPGTPTGDAVPVIIQMNGNSSRSDLMIGVSN